MEKQNKKNRFNVTIIVLCLILIILSIVLPCAILLPINRTAKIIIVSGQSNAIGCSNFSELSQTLSEEKYNNYKTGITKAKFISQFQDEFVNYKFGLNEDPTTFGIELGIIDYFLDNNKKENIYIVKCGVGGTSINYWQPNEEGYNLLCSTLNKAIEILNKKYKKINILSLCWMQGESDRSPELGNAYYNNLNNFVTSLRNDYKEYENFKFIDAAILESNYSDLVNESKRNFANLSDNNYYFEVKNLQLSLTDGVHYNPASQFKLGRKFGEYCFD